MRFLVMLVLVLCSFDAYNQIRETKEYALRISPYYAYSMNLHSFTDVIKNNIQHTYRAIDPIGIKLNYLFNKRNEGKKLKGSFGLNVNYRSFEYQIQEDFYDSISNTSEWDGTIINIYDLKAGEIYKVSTLSCQVLVQLNYLLSPKIELFSTFGLGANINFKKLHYQGKEDNFDNKVYKKSVDEYSLVKNSFLNPMLPYSIKVSQGLRYFFIKNVGIELELSLGNYFLAGGFVFKI